MHRMQTTLRLLLAAACGLALAGCDSGGNDSADGKPTVAFVTNGVDPFWVIAEKGALDAGEDFNVNVEVRMPPSGVEDQKRMVQDLLTKGIDGVAISPIDPANQGDLLNEVAERTNLITHDSDAPESPRLCYVGMDNYIAGRMCGELVKEAMPEGGSVMIFVGRLEQLNARLRQQGVVDEVLGWERAPDGESNSQTGKSEDGKYEILDTRTDQFDYARAKSLAQDAMSRHPNLGCMVGLFAYNPPLCLEAVKEAGKVGEIEICAFDESAPTLQGIVDGEVHGTVVQDPYRYGYESVRILAGLARGDKSVLPEGGFLNIEARKITKENVNQFWNRLKELTAPREKSEAKDSTSKSQ